MIVNNLRVEDICDFIGGSQPAKSEFINEPKEGYVRLIQTRDYKTDAFPTYIPEKSTRKFCDVDDVMIGRYGPPIFQICRGLKGAYNVALLKAKPKKGIDREFLYYFLKQDAVFQYVDKLSARTGGQTGVDLVSLNKYPVRVPTDIDDQEKLVASLVAIDKKIELNNRINAELEYMAKTLYDYWFVQFDFPDAKGKPYKTSGGKMVYNPTLKREIPKGWEADNVLKVAQLLGGGTPTKTKYEYWNGAIPFFTPTDSDKNIFSIETEDYITEEGLQKSSTRLFEPYTVFITARGSVGRLALNAVPMAMNQSCYALRAKDGISHTFLFFLTKELIHHLEVKASGSVFNSIVSNDIEYTNLAFPSGSELFKKYAEIAEPIFEKIESTTKENKKLSSLRDWLLPMLMNGQVTVK
ncbi:restriction endonuclease subunit S [Pseudoalteromonas sp. bablab_jr004]|uniref:restriction endonuclease subunit S n=1 Tax=Pseudoalteromonas sp. bablab_jr004 TaxID=2755065 RepID=UPI0018F66F36|nr:restriction endonuclease subunit S [Pseudoalteromonas sp. bablab_jr004]